MFSIDSWPNDDGMLPVSELYWRNKLVRFRIGVKTVGTLPRRRLYDKSANTNDVRPENDAGIVPLKLLLVRSSTSRLCQLPYSDGKVPRVRPLPRMPTCNTFRSSPKEDGNVQPRFCRYRYFKAVSVLNHVGTHPVRELVSIWSPSSFVSNDNAEGTGPTRRLFHTRNKTRLEKVPGKPNVVGIVLLSMLSVSSSAVRRVRAPRAGGMGPVNALSDSPR